MEIELICLNCKNYNIDNQTCTAFPKFIPEEIWVGLNNHQEPLPNQENNIVFDSKTSNSKGA